MKLLLDTNAFIWLADSRKSRSIGKAADRLIQNADTVYVSAISIAEIRIKTMAGKLKSAGDIQGLSRANGLQFLDFTPDHADALADFQSLARHDPFDRMLLAQAATDGLTFLTGDQLLLALGLPFVTDVGL